MMQHQGVVLYKVIKDQLPLIAHFMFFAHIIFEGQFQNSYINNVKMREVAFTDFGYNITRISLKKTFYKS